MDILLLGITIFFGVHLVPSFVNFRKKAINGLGEARYKGLYSITALLGLVLIIYGMSEAEYQPIWEPPYWSRKVVIVTMLLVFYLFVAADMKSNIKRFIRHPMLFGVFLWSCVHLFANGDLASITLFGSFAIYSLFAIVSANLRGALLQTEKYPVKNDIGSFIAGLVAYAVFVLVIHPYLIGVPVI
ncbi:MAG: hypothetical protein DIZ80_16170 [endosymbiont of Galathealinum brachiosum]|uniref:NnrU domain-containing protein n=1 Tax=endosymbiont of Galathealinum brachiosum TaxID=2200906 RepID=A0A370DBQ0_9GAMM|nr:MAG: hypothetical protein DIZ80_16170 [endosymbiont of Galathealinum brachiosum]